MTMVLYPDPLALLSQTMLIRDESIVKFSTDLPEADRFDLFYKAIGLTDLVRIEKRANAIVQQLKRKSDDLERESRVHRETVGQVISEISEARAAAAQLTTSDIATTQRALAALAGLPSNTSLRQLAVKVSQILTEQKGRVQLLERLNTDISKSLSWREQLQTLEAKCEAVKREVDATELALKTAAESRIATGEKLRMAQARTPDLVALAQMREHGVRINLQDGHCPLCGSAVSKPDFEAHLKHIQNEIERQNKTLGELTAQEESSRIDYEKRRNEFQTKSNEYSRAMSDCETLKKAMAQLQSEAASLGVKLELASVESELQETRKRVSELQSGLLQLEGSSAFDRIADLERQRNFAQTEVERITREIDSLSQATQNAKNAADTTKRVSWESVDDCLAALLRFSPNYLCVSSLTLITRKCAITCVATLRDFLALRLGRASTPVLRSAAVRDGL